MHEDSKQAKMAEGYQSLSEDESGRSRAFLDPDDPGICDDCEEPVRRAVAAVTEAKFQPRRVVVEEEFRCGCGGVTIGTQKYAKSEVPDGWY